MQIRTDRGDEVLNVGVLGPVIVVVNLTDFRACRAVPVSAKKFLNAVFDRVSQFEAAPGKKLNAVIRHGIV